MIDINKIKEKFEKSVFENLNKENFYEIIKFLSKEKCDYIDDIVSDYLDLFNIEYDEFINKFTILNSKYKGEFLKKAGEDMNLLEEFYEV